MIGIVCAFFHTEGKGFYSSRPQSVAVNGAVCFWDGYWLREKGWMQLEVIDWIKK